MCADRGPASPGEIEWPEATPHCSWRRDLGPSCGSDQSLEARTQRPSSCGRLILVASTSRAKRLPFLPLVVLVASSITVAVSIAAVLVAIALAVALALAVAITLAIAGSRTVLAIAVALAVRGLVVGLRVSIRGLRVVLVVVLLLELGLLLGLLLEFLVEGSGHQTNERKNGHKCDLSLLVGQFDDMGRAIWLVCAVRRESLRGATLEMSLTIDLFMIADGVVLFVSSDLCQLVREHYCL